MAGRLPVYLFEGALDAPIILSPVANHDNNRHAGAVDDGQTRLAARRRQRRAELHVPVERVEIHVFKRDHAILVFEDRRAAHFYGLVARRSIAGTGVRPGKGPADERAILTLIFGMTAPPQRPEV